MKREPTSRKPTSVAPVPVRFTASVPRLASSLLALSIVLVISWGATSCGVDIPADQQGFPCNHDGTCEQGLVCIDGVCVTDSCSEAQCSPGTLCVDGECVAGCLIEGALYLPEEGNPDNECTYCEPSMGTETWSPAALGTPCGQGRQCDGEGVCSGVLCEEDCGALDGWYDLETNEYPCCDEGMACVCQEQEHREFTCLEGTCEYTATGEQVVVDGCVTCEDGNPCTDDFCDEGFCETVNHVAGTACGNAGECDGEGLCSEGCVIADTPVSGGLVNPENVCEICDPAIAETSWTPRDGVACEADDECTEGWCDEEGACVQTPICTGEAGNCGCDTCVDCTLLNTWVDVGEAYACCDGDDLCSSCRDQEYREYACSEMTCQYSAIEVRTLKSGCSTCADENACTIDFCDAGTCNSSFAPSGSLCGTAGECDGLGQCSEGCEIGGELYSDGTINPNNPCQVCSSGTSQSAWTNRAAESSCGTGQVCDGNGSCAPRCDLPWGGTIGHNESVVAYQQSTEACGDTCVSQTRTCSFGSLSGTYTYQSCSAPCSTCPTATRTWGGEHGCSASVTERSHNESRTVTNTVNGRTGSATYLCNNGAWELQAGSTCTADGCTSPWSTSVAHGGSVTAYQNSSELCGETCVSQTRTCSYGTLSGTYTHQSCSAPCGTCPTATRTWGGEHGCSASVTERPHDGSRTVTNTVNGRTGSATFLCNNGAWELQAGSTCTADGCTSPWSTSMAHGASVTAYQNSTEACGTSCNSQTRTCSYGTLSGTYTNQSCSAPCASCTTAISNWGGEHGCSASVNGTSHNGTRTVTNTVNGRTGSATFQCNDGAWVLQSGSTCTADGCTSPWSTPVSHGSSVTAYQHSTVACEESCPSQTRTCSYGTLSGTYTNQSCSAPCASCSTATRSWGGHGCSASVSGTTHDGTRTVTNTVDGRTGSATFQCNDGAWILLAGSTCTANSCTTPWSTSVDHGSSVTAYLNSSEACGATCTSQSRSCSYGSLSGSYTNSGCSAPCATCPTSTQSWGTNGCSASVSSGAHNVSRTVTNTVGGRTGSATYSCNDGTWVLQSGSTCTADSCTTPWSTSLAHGASVTAYLNSTEACGTSCSSQTRTCSYGTLSGTYTRQSCSAPCASCPTATRTWGAHSCSASVSSVSHNVSRTVTNTVGGRTGSATYTCNDGTWVLQSGSICTANSCTTPWSTTVNHGSSVTAYLNSTEACGTSCSSQTRSCSYGTLSGTYTRQSCSALCSGCATATRTWGAHSCSASVSSVSHNVSRTVTNTVGGRTGSATYTCNDGTWVLQSGSICTANSCTTPWSTTVNHGSSVTAYLESSVICGASCTSQTRSCSYGTLSGTYENQLCLMTNEGCGPCQLCDAGSCVWRCAYDETCCYDGSRHYCTSSPPPYDICMY